MGGAGQSFIKHSRVMGVRVGFPDLTDSGPGTKPKEGPHEDTVIEAGSRQGELPR